MPTEGGRSGAGSPAPKLGLALSGGGFRAAFFHIGVLAYLAERRLLGKVSTLSTVSGGSIVGTLLYLRWLKLCEARSTAGGTPSDDELCDVVAAVADDLQTAVRHNVRARVFLNPFKNFDMLARPDYSRSDRIGDLYDRYFYKHVFFYEGEQIPWWKPTWFESQIELRQLVPKVEVTSKPPRLILNATCLNTGHSWRFYPERMGEPPLEPKRQRFDRNTRLAWGWLIPGGTAPPISAAQADFPLGLAVAASAAFPGFTSPLPITGMYPGFRVRLMDGGAHDNQGIAALNSENCGAVIVSDGAGQLDDKQTPRPFIPLLFQRIVSMYGDRVREEQLNQRTWDNPEGLVHLRVGIGGGSQLPLGDDGDEIPDPMDNFQGAAAVMQVAPEAQECLARIRTDLDAFNDVESNSLMLCGYRIAQQELSGHGFGFVLGEPIPRTWSFEGVQPLLTSPTAPYLRKLRIASSSQFKGVLLALRGPPPVALALFLGVVALALLVWAIGWGGVGEARVDRTGATLAIAVVLAVAPAAIGRLIGLAFAPPFLRARLARRRWRLMARFAPALAALLAAAGIIALAFAWGARLTTWLGFGMSGVWAAGLAGLLYIALPLAALILSVLWFLDGKLYMWLGRLS